MMQRVHRKGTEIPNALRFVVGTALLSALACSEDATSLETDSSPTDTGVVTSESDAGVTSPSDSGVAPSPAVPVLSPSTVDFGEVPLGVRSERTVFVENRGGTAFRIDALRAGRPFDEGFDFDFGGGEVVAPFGQQPLLVSYVPVGLGPRSAVLTVSTDAPDGNSSPITLAITMQAVGIATQIEVDPSLIDFGNVVVDSTATKQVVLRNNSSVDTVVRFDAGMNVQICPSNSASFCILLLDREIRPDGTFDLRADESTVVEVRFTPPIAGLRETGDFELGWCPSAACRIAVRVSGFGVTSTLRCTPTTVDFGQTRVGACTMRSVACTNIANDTVTIVDWRRASGTSTEFVVPPQSIFTAAPGDTFDASLSYCPNAVGVDEGTFVIETDNLATRIIEFSMFGDGI